MLIRFSEQKINDFIIPSFTLDKGEILVIDIWGGASFYPLILALTKVLTGTVTNDLVEITVPFQFVEHFKEGFFNRNFSPVTVGNYHRKYADRSNPVYKNIFVVAGVTPRSKVSTLAREVTKQLALYTTLSQSNNIIFDLGGIGPRGGKEIYEIVKSVAKSGGSVILLDTCDEFRNKCTTFIKAKYTGAKV